MINDCLAIITVHQDACGEVYTNHADGADIRRYIDCVLDSCVKDELGFYGMFSLGFAAAVDAIAGGRIDFQTPNVDVTLSLDDIMHCRGGESAVKTDVATMFSERYGRD